MSMKDGTVNPEMFANFEEIMKAAVKQKQPFQRLTISKAVGAIVSLSTY